MQYTLITTTPIDEQTMRPTSPGAINGGLMDRSDKTPTPVITIGVDSVEEALKKVEAEGGIGDHAEHADPGDGGVRLLQGLRRQRDGAVPVAPEHVATPGDRGGSSHGRRRAARPAPVPLATT